MISRKQICVVILFIVILSGVIITFEKKYLSKDKDSGIIVSIAKKYNESYLAAINDSVVDAEEKMAIVYDGLTMDELVDKLNRYLKSDLSGKGYLYASHSLELGIDPYLAVAISMHETGCRWGCSLVVRKCNNVGGQVGYPRCDGGIYKSYATLDEGIIGFMDNIYNNYYAYGLVTPEQMNPKYAEDPNWAYVVNKTIEQIKRA